MRYLILFISAMFAMFLIVSCGDEDEEEAPTTGTVSGTVTFMGTPPEGEINVRVSIFSVVDEMGRPTGPPDHHSEPFAELTGQVTYKIAGVSFGEYKLAAVGLEFADSPVGTPQTVLGAYGMAPPADMQADPLTVSEDQPDVTEIDIIADYAAAESSGHQ
jgi:hypothetical protein